MAPSIPFNRHDPSLNLLNCRKVSDTARRITLQQDLSRWLVILVK